MYRVLKLICFFFLILHLLHCLTWQHSRNLHRQQGAEHLQQVPSQRSCFLGLETRPELIWEDWDVGKEFTKTLVIKNIHSKLQKLHLRSHKNTHMYTYTYCIRSSVQHTNTHRLKVIPKLSNIHLISIYRLTFPVFAPSQSSSVQVLHHLDSPDNCCQPRDFIFSTSHLQTTPKGNTSQS